MNTMPQDIFTTLITRTLIKLLPVHFKSKVIKLAAMPLISYTRSSCNKVHAAVAIHE